jgi:hypothetical protein
MTRVLRRRHALVVAATAALSPVLAACGSSENKLDTVTIERAIAQSILAQRHLYATVSCPTGIQRKAGRDFTCTARLDVGTYPVRVRQTDDKGHVRWSSAAPLVALNISAVKAGIRHSIRTQRHLATSKIACPREVLQKAGVVFTCTVTVNGKAYRFTVTEIDGRGHVKYVGQ